MSVIPLDLQRKFELRWAARFVSPVAPAAPKSKVPPTNLPRTANAKEKPANLSKRA